MSASFSLGRIRHNLINLLRWFFSIGFFFLAITKGSIIATHGLEPYKIITSVAGLPGFASYYGVVAVVVEVGFAIGVWYDKTYKTAILLAGLMTSAGIAISIVFIVYKLNSDCGCGLVGDNEYGLLFQKLIILFGLAVLYKNKQRLFLLSRG